MRAVIGAQFFRDVVDVLVDGARRNPEFCGDFLGGEALRGKRDDLLFTRRQHARRRRGQGRLQRMGLREHGIGEQLQPQPGAFRQHRRAGKSDHAHNLSAERNVDERAIDDVGPLREGEDGRVERTEALRREGADIGALDQARQRRRTPQPAGQVFLPPAQPIRVGVEAAQHLGHVAAGIFDEKAAAEAEENTNFPHDCNDVAIGGRLANCGGKLLDKGKHSASSTAEMLRRAALH